MLYHFTDVENLDNILETNTLYGRDGIVSLTRSYNMINTEFYNKPVRFTFDSNKLKRKYKIVPKVFYNKRLDADSYEVYKHEEEEAVLTDEIKNLNDYIVQIDISLKYVAESFKRGYPELPIIYLSVHDRKIVKKEMP